MTNALRTRSEVARDIAFYRREARARYGTRDYDVAHFMLNELLDEWERTP